MFACYSNHINNAPESTMNYAQAQYSTDSGKADILNYLLAGKHDDADIKIAACYMSKSLRVGTMRGCVALVKAAIATKEAK